MNYVGEFDVWKNQFSAKHLIGVVSSDQIWILP
jgi:hypothetical protein